MTQRQPLEKSFTMDEAAVELRICRRMLQDLVARHPHYHANGRRKLLATGDRTLIENSWRDDFWGWGPKEDGQNMLGKCWMEVRAMLRNQPAKFNLSS